MASTVDLAGIPVGRVGLGCMGMSFAYQVDPDSDDPIAVIGAAIESGTAERQVLIDTADVYGPFVNEDLVGAALARHGHEHVVIATKGGLVAPGGDAFQARPDGHPKYLRKALEGSLRRLGVDAVDLYQLHRVDPVVPAEESWGALAELVSRGLIRLLGAPSASPDQLTALHAIHPVASVQGELSLLARDTTLELIPWCEANGTVFVAYGPLTRGLMTGALAVEGDYAEHDVRSKHPAFASDQADRRRRQVELVTRASASTGATAGQVTLARLFALSPAVMAIPGTRRISRWAENHAAIDVRLTPDALVLLDDDAFLAATAPRS